jgi:hypothetical protein
MECKKEKNLINCNCSYSCSKKGNCCDCLSYHRKNGELPACYFPNEIEKNYNRSIDNFIKTVKDIGISYLK